MSIAGVVRAAPEWLSSTSVGGLALTDAIAPPDWMRDALCAEYSEHADWWFPERGASTREAKAVCAGCLVREECLEWALDNKLKHGIWGGTSERERRSLLRARPRAVDERAIA